MPTGDYPFPGGVVEPLPFELPLNPPFETAMDAVTGQPRYSNTSPVGWTTQLGALIFRRIGPTIVGASYFATVNSVALNTAASIVPAVGNDILRSPTFLLEPGNPYRFVLILGDTANNSTHDCLLVNVDDSTSQVIESPVAAALHKISVVMRPTGPRNRIIIRATTINACFPIMCGRSWVERAYP